MKMNNIDEELAGLLGETGKADADKNLVLRKTLLEAFDSKIRRTRIITWISVAFFGLVCLSGIVMIVVSGLVQIIAGRSSIFLMFLGTTCVIIGSGGDTLAKLWYSQVHSRITILKELKKLQFQLADLASKDKKASD
jgi:hypothetical protein